MRYIYVIWFYSPFPEAIPFRKVGCPRVTHPFATFCHLIIRRIINGFSFDLHVLSIPPAFVLSQDQTLNLICKFFQFVFNEAVLILVLCFLELSLSWNFGCSRFYGYHYSLFYDLAASATAPLLYILHYTSVKCFFEVFLFFV